jgi:hypothetical protein
MCFTTAQMVMTVFVLGGPKVFGIVDMDTATSIWNVERDASEIDAEFECWVRVSGSLLLDFI